MSDIETFLSEVEEFVANAQRLLSGPMWDDIDKSKTWSYGTIPRLLQIVRAQQSELAAMRAEKQSVIDGMTRAITAEGKANEAFYAMQAERDKLEAEHIRCLRDASEVLANLHNVESERDALRERVEKLEADNRSCALSAAHAHEREAAAHARIAPLNTELIKTRQERDDARTDVRHLFSSLDEAKAEIIRLGQSVWSLETENAALREMVKGYGNGSTETK